MSDSHISICSIQKTDKVDELKKDVLNYLQSIELISKTLTDCLLDEKKQGYPSGEKYLDYITEKVDFSSVCGVEIITGRHVVTGGENYEPHLKCPNCNTNLYDGINEEDFLMMNLPHEIEELEESVNNAISQWNESGKENLLTCTNCNVQSSITKWDLGDTLALTDFEILFWNWPDLKNSFIESLETEFNLKVKLVNGHI